MKNFLKFLFASQILWIIFYTINFLLVFLISKGFLWEVYKWFEIDILLFLLPCYAIFLILLLFAEAIKNHKNIYKTLLFFVLKIFIIVCLLTVSMDIVAGFWQSFPEFSIIIPLSLYFLLFFYIFLVFFVDYKKFFRK